MSYSSNIGLPKILINFKSQSATAMIRSSRGTVVMILNDSHSTNEDGVTYFNITEAGDIPNLDDSNVDLIKKGLLGAPKNILAYVLPNAEYEVEKEVATTTEIESTTEIQSEVFVAGVEDLDDPELSTEDHYETQTVTVPTTVTVATTTTVTETVEATVTAADALKQIGDIPFNWICHPTGGAQDQEDLASWVISQRKNKNKTFKAVVAHYAADDEGVVNFTTENIKIVNPAYTDALAEVGNDAELVDENISRYLTYTATAYTSRIAGLLAGLSLDRSATYYQLPEIVTCARYADIDAHINNGEFCLLDEHEGMGVKIARGINSLTTFTAEHGTDFRFIKVIESIDLISDDIRRTFREDYVGKVLNTYTNKKLFISAILTYFKQLESEGILDNSDTDSNFVEIDYDAQADFAKSKGENITDWTEQRILEYNTGTHVFLSGRVHVSNAMEDLQVNFVL